MIGIDILEIEEISKLKNPRAFLEKYFSERERAYIDSKSKKEQTIAGIFCAKEAVLKAFKIGIGAGVSLKDIEILHEESGSPYLCVNSCVLDLLKKHGRTQAEISISHSKNYAVAVCYIN